MAPRGGYYFSHIRGESSMLLDSINEAIRIGEEAGVGVQISHVKASGRENWPKIDAALRLFESAGRAAWTCSATSILTTPAARSSTT